MKLPLYLITMLCLFSFSLPFPALAGGGHHHKDDGSHAPLQKLSTKKILNISLVQIGILVDKKVPVEKKTLDASWKNATQKSMKIKTLKHRFIRVQISHPTDSKKLFLLLSSKGELRSANYSGVFKGLH